MKHIHTHTRMAMPFFGVDAWRRVTIMDREFRAFTSKRRRLSNLHKMYYVLHPRLYLSSMDVLPSIAFPYGSNLALVRDLHFYCKIPFRHNRNIIQIQDLYR